jgi:aspartokinase/homoserine dehydrogenase 1
MRRSIAQGCSEYNITVLIDQKDSVRALRAVHGRFYLATLPLGVGLVGPGLIGGTFLDQIHQQMMVRFLRLYLRPKVPAIGSQARHCRARLQCATSLGEGESVSISALIHSFQ